MRIASRVPPLAVVLVAACTRGNAPTLVPSPTARAAVLAIVSGNDQQAKAGERLGQPLVVRVTDSAGQGVGDVAVSFDVVGRAGGLDSKDAPGLSRVVSQTDPTGHARVTLEPYEIGLISVTVRVEQTPISPVTFVADATGVVVEFWSMRSFGYYAAFYGPCRCARAVNTVTVPVGTPVEWKTLDEEPYTVTSTATPQGGPAFDSGTLTANSRFRFVPSVVGTWEYYDTVSGLKATLKSQ